MSRVLKLVLFAFLLPIASFASDIWWVNLTPVVEYQDLTQSCSPFITSQLYLVSEVDGDHLVSASLKRGKQKTDPSIQLLSEELGGISLHRDPSGRLWIQRLSLNRRLLQWAIKYGSDLDTGCDIADFKSVNPEPADFIFDMSVPDGGGFQCKTQQLQFQGVTVPGASFKGSLYFQQNFYSLGED